MMMRELVLCMTFFFYSSISHSAPFILTPTDKQEIAKRIWFNEGSGCYDTLVFWNQNEKFPSLGICHFIWFPENCNEPYTQTVPELLHYIKKHAVQMPAWLNNMQHAPWPTRAEFLKSENQQKVEELRALMKSTMHLQVDFIIDRFERIWADIEKQMSCKEQQTIIKNYQLLTGSPQGIFALLDYLNFKGAGIDEKERYGTTSWGLLQVMQNMPLAQTFQEAIAYFISAAKQVLTNRVSHAPEHKKKHEQQWLIGWFNRIDRYAVAFC